LSKFIAILYSKKRLSILIFSVLTALLLNQSLFYYLAKANGERYFTGIKSILNNEANVGNSYLIARTLNGMVDLGFIDCVKLDEVSPSSRNFLDMTYKKSCNDASYWSESITQGTVDGVAGNKWHISFVARSSWFFLLSLWLGRIFSILLISIFLTWSWVIFDKQERLRLFEGAKKEKIKNLAAQVAHDVASPLSALNLIAGHPSLSPEVRELLNISAQRTQEIIQSLREQVKNVDISIPKQYSFTDVVLLVNEIIREKSVLSDEIEWSFDKKEEIFCCGEKMELGRIISNVINNSIEARATDKLLIRITIAKTDIVSITISDNGRGMSSEILEKIGQKGATFGKVGGTGLGLFYARSYLESIGGKLIVKSEVGIGTGVTLYLPTTYTTTV
jgi:nitrogen-specific signal transduction histidine kinase